MINWTSLFGGSMAVHLLQKFNEWRKSNPTAEETEMLKRAEERGHIINSRHLNMNAQQRLQCEQELTVLQSLVKKGYFREKHKEGTTDYVFFLIKEVKKD